MALTKKASDGKQGGVPIASADIPFPPALSELKQHLCCERYPTTGEPRQTTTITVFLDAGVLKCFVNDRDNGLSTCVTGDSWQGLFLAVEKALSDAKTDWRRKKG
jgi:hypothetical protein